jgi:hypothetical protein
MNHQRMFLISGGGLLLLLAAACTTLVPIQTPTLTSITMTATSIPSKATTELPTITPAPSITPTTTFPPEEIALSAEDIAGNWFLPVNGQGGLIHFDATFAIQLDGTYSIDDITNGMHIERGTFTFKDKNLVLDSDECYDLAKAVFFHCIGIYTVYTTKQADAPVRLRFVPVDDSKGGDRAKNLKNRILTPIAP